MTGGAARPPRPWRSGSLVLALALGIAVGGCAPAVASVGQGTAPRENAPTPAPAAPRSSPSSVEAEVFPTPRPFPTVRPTATLTPFQPVPREAHTENLVEIVDNGFWPSPLHVAVGTTVTWVHRGGSTHNVQSDRWDSGPLRQDQTFSYTFETPGEFAYWCSYHSGMYGRVVVTP